MLEIGTKTFFHTFFFYSLFILAVLDLHYYAGFLYWRPVAVRQQVVALGLLIAAASLIAVACLIAEQGLRARGFQ